MLIKCPECNNEYSSYAPQCPNCAFPTALLGKVDTSSPIEIKPLEKPKTKPKRKHMRLPNGYGYIQNDKRRIYNPYIAYLPLTKKDYDDNGKPMKRTRLGAYPTYNKAYESLVEWHRLNDGREVLFFKDVFKKWYDEYRETDVSESALASYRSGFNNVVKLHNLPITQIYRDEMQQCLDECDKGYSTLCNIVKTYNAIFKYAMANNLVEKDYSKYVKIKSKNDIEKGEPFTESELKILWDNKDREEVQVMLILIYSGLRIGELEKVEIDIKNHVMRGGSKTKQGKNRIIPVHDSIYEMVKNFDQAKFKADTYRKIRIYPTLEELGIATTQSGKKHTPHDARHTFSWLCDTYGVEEISKYLIIGHKLGNDVDKTVYTHRTEEQLKTEIAKIVTI